MHLKLKQINVAETKKSKFKIEFVRLVPLNPAPNILGWSQNHNHDKNINKIKQQYYHLEVARVVVQTNIGCVWYTVLY